MTEDPAQAVERAWKFGPVITREAWREEHDRAGDFPFDASSIATFAPRLWPTTTSQERSATRRAASRA
jgi:hypothetical protein